MKIAGIHCWLFNGGALEVFKDLLLKKIRDNADSEYQIFTLIADTPLKTFELFCPWSEETVQISVIEALPKRMSFLFIYFSHHQIPIFSSLFNYRNLIVFYPFLMKILSRKLKRFAPDEVLISSFAIAKNITLPNTCHHSFLYLHSPMQYIRSHYQEYFSKFSGRRKKLFGFITPRLRKRDQKYTSFDEVVFNSHYTEHLAQELYGMKGKVEYPTIKDCFYYAGICVKPQAYYVFVGRLVNFIRECDLIVDVFNEIGLPLLIIGSGADELMLKAKAKDNIIFLGWLPPEEICEIVKNSKGLINLAKESFGIGTAEALLMGVPVLGFAEGGTKELVDQDSGILIENKDFPTLFKTLKLFDQTAFDRKLISERIRQKLE